MEYRLGEGNERGRMKKDWTRKKQGYRAWERESEASERSRDAGREVRVPRCRRVSEMRNR